VITALSVLSNLKIACGLEYLQPNKTNFDPLIEIWNIANGVCESVLRGHENRISIIITISDHQIASWSHKKGVLKIWNIDKNNKENSDVTITDCCPMNYCDKKYECSQRKVNFFEQRYIDIQSQFNNTIKIFDFEKNYASVQSNIINITLKEYIYPPTECLILPDKRIFGPVNASYNALKIRDIFSDTDNYQSIDLQNKGGYKFWLLPDGRVMSYSNYGATIWH
jgi:hypothetical protein